MGFMLLATSCLESGLQHPSGTAHFSATIQQLDERVDGYVVNLSFEDLEDLSLNSSTNPFVPRSLRGISAETAERLWSKARSSIVLPPITDLLPDTEVALAEILNEVAERAGIFRFHIEVPTLEGVYALETVLSGLSPFISIVARGFETKAAVIAEMRPLLTGTPNLSFAAQGRLWTEQISAIASTPMLSLIRETAEKYSDLCWASINSNHRSYLGTYGLTSTLLAGSGRTIPESLIEHLSVDGAIVIEGGTPLEATPLLFREIDNVREITRALQLWRPTKQPQRRPTSALEKLAQELRASAG